MNKKTLIPILLLLIFITPALSKTAYLIRSEEYDVKQYCEDNDTLIYEKYNSTTNETISKIYSKPYYGCLNGSAVQPGPSFQYGSLVIYGLIGFIALNMFLIFALQGRHGALQFGLIILSIILLYYLAMSIGLIGEPYTSVKNIETGSQLMYSLAKVYFWFVFLVIGYFLVILIKNTLWSAAKGGKSGKDYLSWGD